MNDLVMIAATGLVVLVSLIFVMIVAPHIKEKNMRPSEISIVNNDIGTEMLVFLRSETNGVPNSEWLRTAIKNNDYTKIKSIACNFWGKIYQDWSFIISLPNNNKQYIILSKGRNCKGGGNFYSEFHNSLLFPVDEDYFVRLRVDVRKK